MLKHSSKNLNLDGMLSTYAQKHICKSTPSKLGFIIWLFAEKIHLSCYLNHNLIIPNLNNDIGLLENPCANKTIDFTASSEPPRGRTNIVVSEQV